MRNLLIIMCLGILGLPANAQEFDQGAFMGAMINANMQDKTRWEIYGSQFPSVAKVKKPKVKELPNGNISYKGKEYTPVNNAATTK